MTLYSFFFYSLIAVVLTQCSNQSIQQSTINGDEEAILVLSKERCRGYCPAYHLEIFPSTKINYEGIAHVKIIGERSYSINTEDMKDLITAFEEINFQDFDHEYLTDFKDLPQISLMYKGYKIDYHEKKAPEKILELSNKMEAFLP